MIRFPSTIASEDMSKPKGFGETLRELREARDISLRALADAAGMDPAYLSRIENGKTGVPKKATVERLARALCEQQDLFGEECKQLERQLLGAADHLQSREDLIDDLADRFGARLREQGFPENLIDDALARVPLATMRKVLLGEEKLEIGHAADYTPEQIRARREAGEEVVDFDRPALASVAEDRPAYSLREDSAMNYLDRHAQEFTTHRRERRARARRDEGKRLRAGPAAEIRLLRNPNPDQERQLRLIAKLIESILEEK